MCYHLFCTEDKNHRSEILSEQDTRKHQRAPTIVPLRLHFGSATEFLRGFTENLSLGGVFFCTDADLTIGSKIDLTIELGPGKGFRAIGEIAWHRAATASQSAGFGIRFVAMDPAHEEWLAKAVTSFLASPQPNDPSRTQVRPSQSQPNVTTAPVGSSAPGPITVGGASREEYLDLGFDEEGPIIGIDLGTCNSCACIVRQGKPEIIPIGDSQMSLDSATLASVVSYDENGHVKVGAQALAGLEANPRRTVFGAKRFIGRTYDSPVVHSMLSRFPYKIVPGPQRRVAVEINGSAIELAQVSAEILKAIREKSSAHLGQQVKRAVVTVPAYYNDNQRAAVVHAGRLAGLTVERVLNEPTAAAIAYGLTSEKPAKVLVYDLGGGTFDVSIMDVRPKVLQVIATAGDTFLGGEDFDNAIAEHVHQKHQQQTGKQLSRNSAAMSLVKEAARKAKQRLSVHEKAMVTVRNALQTDGNHGRIEVELTRPEINALVAPLVARTLRICDAALAEAGLVAAQLDDVILVGGQTHMPLVRDGVEQHFKRRPRCEINPDQVVALGAGLLPTLPDSTQFKDVLSMSIGVAHRGKLHPILKRNESVPCSRNFIVKVPRAQFATHKIEVWQGDEPELHQNEHLGTLSINAVEPGPNDPVPLEVRFALTEDCLLEISIRNVDTGEHRQVLLITQDVA